MKEFFNNFNKWGRRILGVGQPQSEQPQADEEQSQASVGTARPEISQPTGPAGPNTEEAGCGKDSARTEEGETPGTWNPDRECLEIKIYEQVLPPESLSTVMIKLSKGQIRIEGTDKVQQPKLTITEMVFADSEPEAINFYKKNYKKNGSGVDVKVDSDSLSVTEKSSSGVVSGGSGSGQIRGVSGRVVVVDSDIEGDIFNMVSGTTVTNGEQTGSSQLAPRRETRVVLKVPVAYEGEKSEYNSYIIRVNSGNIRIESVTGKYTISADAGDIVVEACNMVDSKIENKAGKTKVAAATLNVSEIKNGSGDIEVIGAKLNSCSIAGKTGKIAVTGGALDLSPITNESGYIEVIGATLNSCAITNEAGNIAVVGTILNSCAITNESGNIEVTDGIFIGENTGENTVKTEAGGILVKFDRDQGEIKVKASVGGYATEKLYFEGVENPNVYFEGVENPNGQTASLILTTQDGEIKVISK